MKRIAFNVATLISLLLFVFTATIWIRGTSRHSGGAHPLPLRWEWSAAIAPGGKSMVGIELYYNSAVPLIGPGPSSSPATTAWVQQFGNMHDFHLLGFWFGQTPLLWSAVATSKLQYDGYTWWLGVPDYALCFIFMTLPTIAGIRYRRSGIERRRIQGLCLICGYDLRATPERCPECGDVPVPKG